MFQISTYVVLKCGGCLEFRHFLLPWVFSQTCCFNKTNPKANRKVGHWF